jgi:hypothetical protein
MAAIVCRFPRERRGSHKPDVRKSRGQDLLYGEAPVPVVSFGIFAPFGIPQNDNATRLQKRHPTVESLPCAAWRLVAIEQEQINGKFPRRCDPSRSPGMHLYPASKVSFPDIRFEVISERPASE